MVYKNKQQRRRLASLRDLFRFNAAPEGRNELRRKYLAERGLLIGQWLTVRFFEWTTSELPVPRFAVAVAVRDFPVPG